MNHESGLHRELKIDASQVTLGDSSTLTLTLSTDTRDRSLAKWLGDQWSIKLAIDHLGDNRLPQHFEFDYRLDGDKLALTNSREPAKRTSLFGKLAVPDRVRLRDKHSVDLVWNLATWNMLGTFTLAGTISGTAEQESRTTVEEGTEVIVVEAREASPELDFGPVRLLVQEPEEAAPVRVTMTEANRTETYDQSLWGLIRRRSLSFSRYRGFIDRVLCSGEGHQGPAGRALAQARPLPFGRLASYTMLKYATEYFLMQETGLALSDEPSQLLSTGNLNLRPAGTGPDLDELRRLGGPGFSLSALRDEYLEQLENEEGKVLPYFKVIREKLAEVPLKNPHDLPWGGDSPCYGILKSKLQAPPLLELIWSYWHEEGGLVQTMNAISLRFQNVRRPGAGPDPLAALNLDPLRPMSNLFWGYIEDERNRLTMNRRNLEYQYEYGFGLIGRGVQPIAVAEHRTFFLRGFHNLLRACTEFYQQANFTTVIPDGFPLLNCLREVHMTLAEGAHNQYGDLPWTARAEMLVQQWLLARPEVREFLGGRVMVPYTEPWMDRVDAMKALQGWNPTNASHFHDLGTFGEMLLLSIRYGAWNSPSVGALNAANWAHYWREEIQRYLHAYKAVTGVDLATDLGDIRQQAPDNEERYLQPAQLIERQLALQQNQLRRTRQLGSGLGQLRRPAFSSALRHPGLSE